jgi:surface antigen
MSNGIIGSVCSANYANELGDISQRVNQLTKSVTLECAPVDRNADGTTEMTVTKQDGSVVAATEYQVSGDKVIFKSTRPIGSTQFDYYCL